MIYSTYQVKYINQIYINYTEVERLSCRSTINNDYKILITHFKFIDLRLLHQDNINLCVSCTRNQTINCYDIQINKH